VTDDQLKEILPLPHFYPPNEFPNEYLKIERGDFKHALFSFQTPGQKWKYKILYHPQDICKLSTLELNSFCQFPANSRTNVCFISIEVYTADKTYPVYLPNGIYYDNNQILCPIFLREYFDEQKWPWTPQYTVHILDIDLHEFVIEPTQHIQLLNTKPGYKVNGKPSF
jgi:hypothetical protein